MDLPKLRAVRESHRLVLNCLYVIVGILAILALSAAFVVPRFVQWGDYRTRLEAIASEALGAKVEIVGAIDFTLLPQPQLKFSDVVVGPSETPLLMVEQVVAEFSLLDFLRDRYVVTRMALTRPVLDVAIDENGLFQSGIALADEVNNSNVSVANASIAQGTFKLTDKRSGESYVAGAIQGDLSLGALRGPFTFQGNATYGEDRYGVRITTSPVDDAGAAQLAVAVRPEDEAFQFSAEGFLTTGLAPRFLGQMTYRQKAPAGDDAKSVQGDLLVTGKIDAGPDRVMVSSFTLQPDENRAGARLTGAVVFRLGAVRDFDAAISGGVIALPPREVAAEPVPEPYELVRLLEELPAPLQPGIPGKLALDVAELNVRAFSVRDLKVEATNNGSAWQVTALTGRLPGETSLRATGTLQTLDGLPGFDGKLSLTSERLDGLAALWRKPADGNPLFNMPGGLDARVVLAGQELAIEDGTLTLEGGVHKVTGSLTFGDAPRLDVTAAFGALGTITSQAVAALLPDLSQDGSFSLSFPGGTFDVTAETAVVDGLEGTALALQGEWSPDAIHVSRFAATRLGGAAFDLAFDASGSLLAPVVSAEGGLRIEAAQAPILNWIYEHLGLPEIARRYLARSFPVDLTLTLAPPVDGERQTLAAIGTVGAATMTLDAMLGQGAAQVTAGPLSGELTLTSDDPEALTAQLGLGDLSLMPRNRQMTVALGFDGTAGGDFSTSLSMSGGTNSLGFEGTVSPGDLTAPSGSGTLRFALSDVATLVRALGGEGLYLPPMDGSGRVSFVGGKSLGLSQMEGTSQGQAFGGDFQVGFDQGKSVVSGLLSLKRLDVTALAGALGGPVSLLPGSEIWPEGPFDIGDAPRRSVGRVSVTSEEIRSGARVLASDVSFDFDWDATNTRLRALQGTVGGGKLTADIGICCAGALADKQLTARATLAGVALDALMPANVATQIDGKVDGSLRIEGTGGSYAAIAAALTGEGSYAVAGLRIERFDPAVFSAIAGIENIVEIEPAELTRLVTESLAKNAFAAEQVGGGLTVAGGVVRAANLAVESGASRLFGSLSVRLPTLALGGGFALTPLGAVDAAGLINETTAGVVATLGGTLLDPERTLGIEAMVDAIKVRALEIELDRLEQLQAEDEARRKAAAEERARIAAEQEAQRKAEEEAAKRKAAEQEAARRALEEEANRIAAEEAQQHGPIDLSPPPAH